MKQILIHYQDNRKEVLNSDYYPEDNKTPKQRLEYINNLNEEELPDGLIVVSACPYIIEALCHKFKDKWQFKAFINGKEVDNINCIFKELAQPLKDMFLK